MKVCSGWMNLKQMGTLALDWDRRAKKDEDELEKKKTTQSKSSVSARLLVLAVTRQPFRPLVCAEM